MTTLNIDNINNVNTNNVNSIDPTVERSNMLHFRDGSADVCNDCGGYINFESEWLGEFDGRPRSLGHYTCESCYRWYDEQYDG